MQERRKLQRKYLAIYSRVFDRDSGKILGYLADMSRKGAMIISDDPMQEKVHTQLRFDLPDPTLFSTDHLNINAHVVWCQPDVDPSFYNIGFEFETITGKQAHIIDQMVEVYEFHRDLPDYPPPPFTLHGDSEEKAS